MGRGAGVKPVGGWTHARSTSAPEGFSGFESDWSGATFAFLWASAHIVHVWHQDANLVLNLPASIGSLITLAAAVALLLRPTSQVTLGALAAAQLVAFGIQFPFVANHWTIAAFVNTGILVALLSRRLAHDERPAVYRFAAFARTAFLIAYGAAALAKLNDTFLSPAHSCALSTLDAIDALFGLPFVDSPAIRGAVIGAVVATELAVPLLLLVPRLRVAGIALAAVFHLALAITPVVVVMDFTLIVLALVVLFAPPDFDTRVRADVQRFGSRRLGVLVGAARRPLMLVLIGVILVGAVGRAELLGRETWAILTWGSFTVFGVLVSIVVLSVLVTYRGQPSEQLLGAREGMGGAQTVVVVLMTLNALSPYLGFKTTSSFTMFSNLRTEAGGTNHLFIPRLGLGGYQDDLLEISESDDRVLQARVDDGQWLTTHEVRRRLSLNPEASAEFVQVGTTGQAATTWEDLTPLAWWEAKFLHFRPVAPTGDPACQP
jgi:hypothetical protein